MDTLGIRFMQIMPHPHSDLQDKVTDIILFVRWESIRPGKLCYRATALVIVASHIIRGHLRMERLCAPQSKFFLLGVDTILERLRPRGRQTGNHELSPFENMAEKDGSVPICLNDSVC